MENRRAAVWCLSFLILNFCCFKEKADLILQEQGLWQNEKKLEARRLLQVGTEDIGQPDYYFGFISDISTDDEDNLYILDYRNCKANKFSSEGKFLAKYGNGKGQGPGEFQFPASICIDSSGKVYISDRDTRKISIFESSGKYVNSFRTERVAPLHDLIALPNDRILVGIDVREIESGAWKGGIFQIYSLPNGKLSGSLGKSWDKRNTRIHVGSNSACVNAKSGEIVISYALPYLIEVFSKNGSLLNRFGRRASFFDQASKDRYGNILACGSSNGVLCLPDGKIVNIVRQWINLPEGRRQLQIYLDFFEKDGKYLITVPGQEFSSYGNYDFTKVVNDRQGNIWIKYEEPYPHVTKYRIDFVDRKR